MTGLQILSYGGGVQSTALLALAATGQIPLDAALFANVGDDSEHPATLRYLRDIAIPWAAAHGTAVHELHRTRRDGTRETLWGRLMKQGSRSLPIPVRMSNGAPGTRSCTADFKIRVIGTWLKQHGATAQSKATVNIGISLDEIERANNRRVEPHEHIAYPLLDLGLRRVDCARIITAQPLPTDLADRLREVVDQHHPTVQTQLRRSNFTRLPVPPKSSCFFCPFHRLSVWMTQRAEEPDLFNKACQLEDTLIARRAELGKDPIYLTRFGTPLRHLIDPGVQLLPLEDTDEGCDSGWCMT
ncbi:phosphoadenosine phosphosulfate reductase [Actinocrispum sp. NPDC049592]|uniref:phosphoadenosine phosphosulfate reductase n=1 Tax=Actinocrispum sp. NPDC049592 TaxID=3154835 RepID=UPI00344995AB